MRKRFKYALLGMAVLPLFGQTVLHTTGLETETLILLMPVLVGGVTGFLIGLANDRLLDESHNLLRTIIDAIPMRIFWKDKELRYLGCNSTFARDAGESSPQDVIGKDDYHLSWKDRADIICADDRQVMDTGVSKLSCDELSTTFDDKNVWLRTSKVPLHNIASEIIGVLGIYQDVTEQKLAEIALHDLAHFDSLTGLPNRALFMDRLQQTLAQAHRNKSDFSLLFLDLDGFKAVNDTLGHEAGDHALKIVADHLRASVREVDTVARLGGDEFTVILPGDVHREQAAIIADKIMAALDEPIIIDGKEYQYHISASIGIAIYPEDGDDADVLLNCADDAMYAAKAAGKNRYMFRQDGKPVQD